MKRISYIIMCVFALLIGAKASAQQLQFEANAEARQGQTAALNISMNNSETVRGFQFDFSLPEGLSPVVSKVGNTEHELSVAKVGENKWRVLSYSMNNAEYPVESGAVACMSVSVPEDFCVGSYTVAAGNAYLSALDNSKIAVEDFTTRLDVLPKYVAAELVTISASTLSLMVGETETLTATVSPDNATEKSVTWTSSEASVATVDAAGKVMAVAVGTATITATCGAVSASCTMNVIPDIYTITYIVDEEVYKTENVKVGTTINPLTAPTKEGHTFSGWSEIPGTMPANDVTVTGSFTVNSYTLIYMVDGEVYKDESIAYGTAITPTAEPTKEGHTFSGWSEIPGTMPASDVIVSGSFSINSYVVIYMVGEEEYGRQTYKFGEKVVAPEDPTTEGYTFDGWNGLPETMPANDVTVTAIMEADAIEEIASEARQSRVYNLQGVLLNSSGKEGVKALSRGLYIINGRKVLVK